MTSPIRRRVTRRRALGADIADDVTVRAELCEALEFDLAQVWERQ
jgi:hypothetical protein